VEQGLELCVFRLLQFGEASRRELSTTEFFTTLTIAISVFSDFLGGWLRETIQTGTKLARAHGCWAFSKVVNLASIHYVGRLAGRQSTSRAGF
jgi:hypothetical protein